MRSRVLLSSLCITTVLLCSGCLYFPMGEHGLLSGRAVLDKGPLNHLKVGESTAEQVLLKLGSPDGTINSGEVFIYSWGTVAGMWMPIMGSQGSASERTYLLLMKFNDAQVLEKYEVLKPGLAVFGGSFRSFSGIGI